VPRRDIVPIKNPKRRKPSTKPTGHIERTQGLLLLDDFLATTDQIRRTFQLPVPQFGLKEMEGYPRAREALEMLIQSTIDRHGTEICARPHPLSRKSAQASTQNDSSQRFIQAGGFSPKWIPESLEKLLEISLQTLPPLPKRDPKPEYSPRQLKLLAARLRKLGEEAGTLKNFR
jgi:hypothetical protein